MMPSRSRAGDATRQDRIRHMANVLRTAQVDGELSPEESQVFDEVAAGLLAGASEIAEARQAAASSDGSLQYAWNPDAQQANYDDMLLMAMADGRFASAEKAWLEEQGAILNLSQDEVNQAVQRASKRLARIREQMQDGMTPSAAARPAPSPGAARAARPEGTVRNSSSSGAAGRAARKPGPAREPLRQRMPPPPHRSERLRGPWEAPPATLEPVPGAGPPAARPSAAAVGLVPADAVPRPVSPPSPPPLPAPSDAAADGMQGAAPDMPPASSDETTLLARCIFARGQAEDGAAYCHGLGSAAANPWGCRLAGMPLAPGAAWLSCGAFRDRRTFVFDKAQIARTLEGRLGVAAACPHFELARAELALAAFPMHALPGPLWVWRDAAPGETGVHLPDRTYVHGCAVNRVRHVAAPDPVGERLLRRLLRDAGAPLRP